MRNDEFTMDLMGFKHETFGDWMCIIWNIGIPVWKFPHEKGMSQVIEAPMDLHNWLKFVSDTIQFGGAVLWIQCSSPTYAERGIYKHLELVESGGSKRTV
jgi:hypothetical protein